MREAVGGLGITQIVIFFLLLFAAYISVSINMSKAQKVKDEVVSIIQKNNGFDHNALNEIENYMASVGYRTNGVCEDGWDGYNSAGFNSNKSLFCIKEWTLEFDDTKDFPKTAYYQVRVFFALDVPVINNVLRFNLTGSTRRLYYPKTMNS